MSRMTRVVILFVATMAVLVCIGGAHAQQSSITFWTFLNPSDEAPRSRVQTTLINSFMKKYPNIKVEVEVLPWNDISPRMIQAVAAGKGPDVVRMNIESSQTQFAAHTILPLDEFTDKWGKAEREDWLLPWDATMYNGRKMGLFLSNIVVMLWHRRDYLESVNATVPKTWEELGKTAAALNRKGKVGFAVGLSTGGSAISLMEWLRPVLWSQGADTLGPDGRAIFNNAAGIKAMQTLHDLVYKYEAIPKEVLQWDIDGVFQGVRAGRVAMATWGIHRVVTAREGEGVGENLQTAPVPSLNPGQPGPGHVTGWSLMMPATVKNKDAAWKFIDHMTSTEAQQLNAKLAGELPSRKSAYADPWFKESKLGSQMVQWKDYLEKYGRLPQFPKDYVYLHNVIAEAAQEIVLNNAPIKKALDEAATKYNKQAGL